MTVGLVIVSHSARLAEGVAELAGQMAPEVRIVAAGGQRDRELGTDYDAVRSALETADAGGGVVVLYDIGSARMIAETAVEAVADLTRAVLADGPLVEGAVAAAVAAQGGSGIEEVARVVAADSGEQPVVERTEQTARTESAVADEHVELVLGNDVGLHARPAALFARSVAELDAEVTVTLGDKQADGKSVLALMGLSARQGDRILVRARGVDAELAVGRVSELVANDFAE